MIQSKLCTLSPNSIYTLNALSVKRLFFGSIYKLDLHIKDQCHVANILKKTTTRKVEYISRFTVKDLSNNTVYYLHRNIKKDQ